MKYGWKPGTRMKVSASVAGKRMRALYKKHGELTTEILKVDAAKKNSPIRECFEWNNAAAADAHRTTQAYQLLRYITFIPQNEKDVEDAEAIRMYFPITIEVEEEDEDGEVTTFSVTSYKDTMDIMNDPADRQQLLARALGELRAFQRKYKMLKDLARAVQLVLNKMAKKKPTKKKKKRTK